MHDACALSHAGCESVSYAMLQMLVVCSGSLHAGFCVVLEPCLPTYFDAKMRLLGSLM